VVVQAIKNFENSQHKYESVVAVVEVVVRVRCCCWALTTYQNRKTRGGKCKQHAKDLFPTIRNTNKRLDTTTTKGQAVVESACGGDGGGSNGYDAQQQQHTTTHNKQTNKQLERQTNTKTPPSRHKRTSQRVLFMKRKSQPSAALRTIQQNRTLATEILASYCCTG
jgi:hypothetical protein